MLYVGKFKRIVSASGNTVGGCMRRVDRFGVVSGIRLGYVIVCYAIC